MSSLSEATNELVGGPDEQVWQRVSSDEDSSASEIDEEADDDLDDYDVQERRSESCNSIPQVESGARARDDCSSSMVLMLGCERLGAAQSAELSHQKEQLRVHPLAKHHHYPHQQQQQQQQQLARAQIYKQEQSNTKRLFNGGASGKELPAGFDKMKHVDLFGFKIVALTINDKDRLCLAQISNTLLKDFSYNEIHNRRVALGITCVQCTPIQLEMLRRAGAMPSSSRRCGMITMREAERLCRSFLAEEQPPELPENFYFTVAHRVNYGCKGRFVPARYISSRAKCIECFYCGEFYSPNKFIFHSHKQPFATDCNPPDSPNINSWRKHIDLDWTQEHGQEIKYAWEDVKSLFNGGTRRRVGPSGSQETGSSRQHQAGRVKRAPAEIVVDDEGDNDCDEANDDDDEDRNEAQDEDKARSERGNKSNAFKVDSANSSGAQQHAEVGGREAIIGARASKQAVSRQSPLSVSERRKMPIGWPAQRQPSGNQSCRQLDQAAGMPSGSTASKRLPVQQGQPHSANKKFACAGEQSNNSIVSNFSPVPHARQQQFVSPPRSSAAALAIHQHNRSTANFAPVRPDSLLAQTELTSPQDRFITSQQASNEPHLSSITADEPGARQGSVQTSSSLQVAAPTTSFIYNQLYSQLIKSHQSPATVQFTPNQQAHNLASIESQLALRHQLWSSLLANLQSSHSNAAATNQAFATTLMQDTHSPLNYNNLNDSHSVSPQSISNNQANHARQVATCDATTASITNPHNTVQNFNLFQSMQMYSPQIVESIFGDRDIGMMK